MYTRWNFSAWNNESQWSEQVNYTRLNAERVEHKREWKIRGRCTFLAVTWGKHLCTLSHDQVVDAQKKMSQQLSLVQTGTPAKTRS